MTRARSLRRTLLIGILAPIAIFIVINSVSLYRQSSVAARTAYDRTLLASAKTIGEQLDVTGYGEEATLHSTVPYSALEAFEADTQSRMVYRVSTLDGKLVTGYDELAPWKGRIPQRPPYAALVDFYDGQFRGRPVRIAVLLQPVASAQGLAMAVVQVAETLELREALARQLLVDMLWRQLLLLAVVAGVTVLVVQRATRPVRALGQAIQARADDDLSPIDAPDAPRELRPLVEATTAVMARLQHLLDHQKRFVRDSAHQLRTPLAVLKAQVQSAQRGDVPASQALEEIRITTERATQLANQMLSLAKVEQLRQQPESQTLDFAPVLRSIVLDLSPLMADRGLDVGVETESAPIHAHQWMLAELSRNLVHNAIKHSPPGGRLEIALRCRGEEATLTIGDDGPGIADELRRRLFVPFAAGDVAKGSGLGLAICREIVLALGGSLSLENRAGGGLDAIVRLPLRRTDRQ
ncbi:sensor histidine kinase [Variovorax sp.]|uniref:sensor histidine kinase n=1 Tax=Variovorax sp. TaxID=1871043 RepID=UPI002D2DB918|nr:sensor histidine kinase N-terminal domain-containing protein [Variovorax sp.]HYP83820.1 sensor histidine kinase N-terminal domain-containing protein [Variovorax sp.]